MIELRELHKRFGPITAVDHVSLKVGRGEVLGFLGPNGAGKSTTMKMLTGYLTPTSGVALIDGLDVWSDPIAVKRRLGYLPEGAPAYPDMTPAGFLHWVAGVRGLRGGERRRRVAEVADRVQLRGVMRQSIDTLSKGYKRRVGLAQALVHDPEVLILDEPTDGLDPNQKHEVRGLIRELAGKRCVVLSTHILEEVDAVCTRAVIIARGKLVADGTPEQLRARSPLHNAVRVRVAESDGASVRSLGSLGSVASCEVVDKREGVEEWLIRPKGGSAIAADIADALRQRGVSARELRVESGRLDEVFRAITGGEARAGARMGAGA